MSIFQRKNPKPHSHRAPKRYARVPLPPGMSAIDTHLYVETDEPAEPATDMTLVAADPDDTMYLPVVEEDEAATPLTAPIEETPAVRPLPARTPFETYRGSRPSSRPSR